MASRILSILSAAMVVVPLFGQAANYAPPPPQQPSAAVLGQINAKVRLLGDRIAALRRQGLRDPILADVEVYHKAAVWMVRHQEFYHKDSADWTLQVLDRGLLRAAQAQTGEAPWLQVTGQTILRGYRSRLDNSVQPYALTLPVDYGRDPRRKWRMDFVLHGRDAGLTEVKFLQQHGDKPAPVNQPFVRMDLYGRGNNAYRWAGEVDVLEASIRFLDAERAVGRPDLIDPGRGILRGFSMGGAGTWHLGLHTCDRWAAIGPGAGFTTTHGYLKDLPEKLPPEQEACLTIYDAVGYAENAFNVPVVAYSGSDDPQKKAADNIEARLKALNIPMTHLVAPGLGHRFPPEWQQEAEKHFARHTAKEREMYPKRVRFVTYTLKYSNCYWVELIGLDQHYRQARVDAEAVDGGFRVKTTNVRTLHLFVEPGTVGDTRMVEIDGQTLEVRPQLIPDGSRHVFLDKREGRWVPILRERLLADRQRRLQKTANLQGPIDDAFMHHFLCVRGTGKPWHEATGRHAEANLKRFAAEWSKYFRGDLLIKDDVDVTSEEIATKHLVLFGDPSSNTLIGHALDGLPLEWTEKEIRLAGKTVSSADHVPVLIYPSPLSPGHYVVLNSGHTFRAADLRGTNALLYPRLGDYALLKPTPTTEDPAATETVLAGLFDEFWRVGP